jgi:hypothetical protein
MVLRTRRFAPALRAYATEADGRGDGAMAGSKGEARDGEHRIVFPANSLNGRRSGEPDPS